MKIEKQMVLLKRDGLTVDREGSTEDYFTEGWFRLSSGENIELDVAGKKQFMKTVPAGKEYFVIVKIEIQEITFWEHGTYQGMKGEKHE